MLTICLKKHHFNLWKVCKRKYKATEICKNCYLICTQQLPGKDVIHGCGVRHLLTEWKQIKHVCFNYCWKVIATVRVDKLVRRTEEEHVTGLIVALNTDALGPWRSNLIDSVLSCPLIDVDNPNLKERSIVNFAVVLQPIYVITLQYPRTLEKKTA